MRLPLYQLTLYLWRVQDPESTLEWRPMEDLMRSSSIGLFVLMFLPSTMIGQATIGPKPSTSRVATLVGMGNSFGGLGVLADFKAFDRSPISFMASVGSVPGYFGDGSEATVALALGIRANAGVGRHQGFLELALLPVDDDVVGQEFPPRVALLYGLGLQLGYRASIGRGLTVNALGGGGYALGKDVVASRLKPLIGFGVGYAWPRRSD